MKIVKILILFAGMIAFFGCKKSIPTSMAESYFEDNVLNRNFTITYALNEGAVITGDYTGYNFLLRKGSDYYNGPLIVTKGGDIYNGTWLSNEDYGKLTIVLPASLEIFKFLSRDWRFTSKKLPVLKFAPWGSTANTALTMERQ